VKKCPAVQALNLPKVTCALKAKVRPFSSADFVCVNCRKHRVAKVGLSGVKEIQEGGAFYRTQAIAI